MNEAYRDGLPIEAGVSRLITCVPETFKISPVHWVKSRFNEHLHIQKTVILVFTFV
jgi:phage replication-related protein YjqB (UPF0714/DUF867 family)